MVLQGAASAARQMLGLCRESAVLTDANLDDGPRILCANDAFWKTTGYAPGELVGNRPRVLRGPAADRQLLRRLRRSLETGASFESRTLNYRKDGTPYLAAWYIEPVRAPHGRVEHFVGLHRDLTHATQQGAELDAVLAALRASQEGLLFVGPQDVVVRTNPAAAEALELCEDEVVGRSLRELVGNHRVEVHEDGRWTVTVTASGEPRTLELHKIGKGGRETFWTIRDTTEKRRLEALANAVNLVEHTGYMFAGIRHELGNPVHSVKMALSVLDKHGETFSAEKRSEFYGRMLDEIERIEFLLGALRNYNAHESQTLESFELNEHIGTFLRVADLGTPQAIALDWTPLAEPLQVRGDPRGLYQVLLNLVKNATDALEGATEPRVTISVRRCESSAAILVSDNGAGMSARRLESIGRPFATTKAHGTGLGLCVSQRILAGMGGVLEFESVVDQGTTARVVLPLASPP